MKKFASFLVDRRKILLCIFLVLAAVSLPLSGLTRINYDLAEYLGPDSRMKQGLDLMDREFGQSDSSRLRVMFSGLDDGEKEEILTRLSGLDHVSSVSWDPGEAYNQGDYTLFELDTEVDSHSAEAASLYNAVHQMYDGRGVVTGGSIHEANVPILPLYVVIVAVALVLLILLVMCSSWFEPLIFLVNIGIAVAINLGTNLVFPSVSYYTNSIVGIMQLVLSMDYSIILLNRYTQEKEKGSANLPAMKAALAAAFPAIAGSSLTTFAGLLCLTVMSFRLGADMGLALAKSVVVSLICIFTVLPSLILMSDRLITKTRKKALHIPTAGYSRFTVRNRMVFVLLFLVLFAGAFLLKDNTEILYMLQMNNPVEKVFEDRHSIVLLYETRDSGRIADVLAPVEQDEKVTGITGYYNTVGKAYTAEELSALFGDGGQLSPVALNMVFKLYAMQEGLDDAGTVTLPGLIPFLREHILDDPRCAPMISDEARLQIEDAGKMLEENAALLEDEHYGRVILTTLYPEDSAETRAFIEALSGRCRNLLQGEYWLIGTSVMNQEMSVTFHTELNRITLLSAAVIFLVVALTFRSLIIPLVLVMTVQCGIYLTMAFIGLSGSGMYYLAILMVQCILMGATIDYAILYTSYYREKRLNASRQDAVRGACDGALHTILTSAMIMIVAAGILGYVFANPAIGEICLTISRGAISATLLIVFVLPGVIAALDRFIAPKKCK